MGHQCEKGHTVIVAYMFRSERRFYSACSKCDSTDLWPNFVRTSPKVSKD